MIFFFSRQFRREVVHSLNDNVLVKIKQMGLSCYTMVCLIIMHVLQFVHKRKLIIHIKF